ncbi:MAG: cysteine synthase A [Clostridia bacterium]|nr:cysteine synthase A [Clostridia bacterium]
MGRIFTSAEQLIGGTPLLELVRIERRDGLKARLLAKLESFNPGGSVKDRAALGMINDAERRGLLSPGSTIIEPTSGNTGIGLALAASLRGYRTVIVMPETMSAERRRLLAAFGAQIVLTDGARGMAGAIEKAAELAAKTPGSFMPGQFENPANPESHYLTTGPEIWEDTDGRVDLLVAGVGTGGTLTGAGRYLKEKDPRIKIIAVEPASSPVLSGGEAGPHGLQGIGAGFVPKALDAQLIDAVVRVRDEDAYAMGRRLAREEGVFAGITSGAAVFAAAEISKLPENAGKTAVVILPDDGGRYLSTPLFE